MRKFFSTRFTTLLTFTAALACLFAILPSPSLGGDGSVDDGGAKQLAVLPWKVNSEQDLGFVRDAVTEMLTSRVGSAGEGGGAGGAGGGVKIIRPDIVSEAAASHKYRGLSDKTAASIGASLEADYVVYGSLTVIGSAVSLDARLLDVSTGDVATFTASGKGLDSIIGLTDSVSTDLVARLTGRPQAPAAGALAVQPQPAPAPAPPQPEAGGFILKTRKPAGQEFLFKSGKLDGMYNSMAAADLDGDGFKELFVLSGSGLAVLRPGPDGFKTVEVDMPSGQNISIAAADTDGDGAREVYVSRIVDDSPDTRQVTYRGDGYVASKTGSRWLVRTVTGRDGKGTLVGQRFRGSDGFHGEVRRLTNHDGTLVDSGKFVAGLPRGVDLFRLALMDVTGDGSDELAAVDSENRLRIYGGGDPSWSEDWMSPGHYGGTLTRIELAVEVEGGLERRFIPVAGRMLAADTDGDGTVELVVRKNTPGGIGWYATTPRSFKKGAVASLGWDGETGGMVERWSTREVPGFVADFIIDDLDGDGARELTMLVAEGTEKLFGSIKSYVLSYALDIY